MIINRSYKKWTHEQKALRKQTAINKSIHRTYHNVF